MHTTAILGAHVLLSRVCVHNIKKRINITLGEFMGAIWLSRSMFEPQPDPYTDQEFIVMSRHDNKSSWHLGLHHLHTGTRGD